MKGIVPSKHVRPHMLTLDIGQAVYDCTDEIEDLRKTRARLIYIMRSIMRMIGPKDVYGHWIFANTGGQRTYQRTLSQVMAEVFAVNKKTADGLQWIILLHGMAEDCEDLAKENGQFALAHRWKLVYRLMGWVHALFEPQYPDDASAEWAAAIMLYDRITKKIGMQK